MRAVKVRQVISPHATIIGRAQQFLKRVAAFARLVGTALSAVAAGAHAHAGKFQIRFAERHRRIRIVEFGGGIFRCAKLRAQQEAAGADGGVFDEIRVV